MAEKEKQKKFKVAAGTDPEKKYAEFSEAGWDRSWGNDPFASPEAFKAWMDKMMGSSRGVYDSGESVWERTGTGSGGASMRQDFQSLEGGGVGTFSNAELANLYDKTMIARRKMAEYQRNAEWRAKDPVGRVGLFQEAQSKYDTSLNEMRELAKRMGFNPGSSPAGAKAPADPGTNVVEDAAQHFASGGLIDKDSVMGQDVGVSLTDQQRIQQEAQPKEDEFDSRTKYYQAYIADI